MEEQLRDLVRANGFEAVFTTLKVLVTGEFERAKRDYDFLQSLIAKPEPAPEAETVEIDTKRISIKDGAKVKLPRKAPKTPST